MKYIWLFWCLILVLSLARNEARTKNVGAARAVFTNAVRTWGNRQIPISRLQVPDTTRSVTATAQKQEGQPNWSNDLRSVRNKIRKGGQSPNDKVFEAPGQEVVQLPTLPVVEYYLDHSGRIVGVHGTLHVPREIRTERAKKKSKQNPIRQVRMKHVQYVNIKAHDDPSLEPERFVHQGNAEY